jgi:hypothetical protein
MFEAFLNDKRRESVRAKLIHQLLGVLYTERVAEARKS